MQPRLMTPELVDSKVKNRGKKRLPQLRECH